VVEQLVLPLVEVVDPLVESLVEPLVLLYLVHLVVVLYLLYLPLYPQVPLV
jgi:hypothetical protein